MRRRFFDALCLLSLLVALLAAGLWARTSWWATTDELVVETRATESLIASTWGGVGVELLWLWPADEFDGWQWSYESFTDDPATLWWPLLAVGSRWEVFVPFWLIMAVMFGVSGISLLLRGARSKVGHCPACGYDRRGTAEGEACPECGAERGIAAG